LPDGYDTVVGPGSGVGLSAGQRQRLGFARALLRNTPLLVLDEPTAYLDVAAARQVRSAVEGLRGRCAVVLVTHDEALLPRPDQVVRLAAGRLVATTAAA
jgi:ABC-type multidrug transport system fused ATPase/permease subunit